MDELINKIKNLKKDISECWYLSGIVKDVEEHMMWKYLAGEKENKLYHLIGESHLEDERRIMA